MVRFHRRGLRSRSSTDRAPVYGTGNAGSIPAGSAYGCTRDWRYTFMSVTTAPDLRWFKSTKCADGHCVFVAHGDDTTHVRDASDRQFECTHDSWSAFVRFVKQDQ